MVILPVEHTWDGRAVERSRQARVVLASEPGVLVIRADSPLGEDPPPPSPPGPTDHLWEHEVVELFVVGPDDRYTEIELGPWGHHLVLRLHGPRQVLSRCLPLDYRCQVQGARWSGEARLDRALLPAGPHRVNAFAIRRLDGERQLFAWSPVPGDRPDFHRIGLFPSVELPQ